MGDDRYSASELRQRYGPGGSLNDSELSASQIRARHGIQGNTFSDTGPSSVMLIALAVAAIVGALALYKLVFYFCICNCTPFPSIGFAK
jgi:hypothetical protein